MLNLLPGLDRDCERISRRCLLQVGGLAGLGHGLGKQGNDTPGLCRDRLPRILRWHFSQVKLVQDILQQFTILRFAEIDCQLVEAPLPLLFLSTMAAQAILLEKRANSGLEIFLGSCQWSRQQQRG